MKLIAKAFLICMLGLYSYEASSGKNSPEPGGACPSGPSINTREVGTAIHATMVFYPGGDQTTQFDALLKFKDSQWELMGPVSLITFVDVPLSDINEENLEDFSFFSIPLADNALTCVKISEVDKLTVMTNARIAEVLLHQVEEAKNQ